MHTVLTTPTFDRQADAAGLTDSEVMRMVSQIAKDPLAGDLVPGTGGARKLRFARQGRGKSGGYRTIHYYAGKNVPVFLLSIIVKTERGNLSKAERNELALLLPQLADAYQRRVVKLRRP